MKNLIYRLLGIICFIFLMGISFGQISTRIIYVSPDGDDNAAGTSLAPKKTLSGTLASINANEFTYIRMLKGVYNENQIIDLSSNLIIEGGWFFDNTKKTWVKHADSTTTININAITTIGNANHRIGFRSINDTNWMLKNLTVNVIGATTADRHSSGKGTSVYGIYTSGVTTNTYVERCNLVIGNGGSGQNGTAGTNGQAGNNGSTGDIGTEIKVFVSWGCTGGESVAGGAAKGSGTLAGGKGGSSGGGRDGNLSSGNRGYDGSAGSNGGGGAVGGTKGSGGAAGGSVGGNGGNGSNGTNGSNGQTINAYTISEYFEPGNQSASGTNGTGGAGGGGGGGGGSAKVTGSWSGGGGGGGGTAGTAGSGGIGGGGVFGLYSYITSPVTLTATRVLCGQAGVGGNGGAGGIGGAGGTGGAGYVAGQGAGSVYGGTGGNGGKGGNGGNGAKGADGISIPYIVVNSSGHEEIPIDTLTPSDSSILSTSVEYTSFTNSQIILRRGTQSLLQNSHKSGSQSFLQEGLHFINDILPDSSSYTANSETVIVVADNVGLYTINAVGETVFIGKKRTLGTISVVDSVLWGQQIVATYSNPASQGYQWKLVDSLGNVICVSDSGAFAINTEDLAANGISGSLYHIGLTVNLDEEGKSDYIWASFRVYPILVSISISSDTLFTYDGLAKQITATTDIPNVDLLTLYNNLSDNPINAGTYHVAISVATPNHYGQAFTNMIIKKAAASISLRNTTFIFDSTAHFPTINTSPSGLKYNILVDSSDTISPVNAGTYNIIAVIDEANYEGDNSVVLTINKATASINFTDLVASYNTLAHQATVNTIPAALNTAIRYSCGSLPIQVGTYTIYATVLDSNYEGFDSATFTINKCTSVFNMQDSSIVYDGLPHQLNSSIEPNFVHYKLTYNGDTTKPTDAGTYNVVAVSTDTFAMPSIKTATLVINKAVATIEVSDLIHTYDGTPKSIQINTIPAGLTTSVLYNNDILLPINSDTIPIRIVVTDKNYKGELDTFMIINKATASITHTGLQQTYTGNELNVGVITSPNNLSVVTTYNASNQKPVNRGIYIVESTIVDRNYVGSQTDTMIIEKDSAVITISNLSHVFDNTDKQIVVTTSPSGLNYQITYNNSSILPVNVGDYQVVVDIIDSNYFGQATATMTITPALVSIQFADMNHVYDMQSKQPVINLSDSVNYNISFNGINTTSVVNSGVYNVVVTITSPNYNGCDSALFTIEKAQAYFDIQDTIVTYNQTEQGANIQVTPTFTPFDVLYEGSTQKPINAGIYNANIVINDTNIVGNTSFVFQILPLQTSVIYSDTIQIYDGQPKSIVVTTADDVNFTITYLQNNIAVEPINAGLYDVEIQINEPNYEAKIFHTSLSIIKAMATLQFGEMTYMYDNTPKSAPINIEPDNLSVIVTYNGSLDLPVEPGAYFVVATVDDINYQGSISDTLYIKSTTDIKENIAYQGNVNLYPNPTKEQANLSIEPIFDKCNIQIIDVQGKILYQEQVSPNDTLLYSIDVANFKNGIYFIRIQTDKTIIVKKLIKE